MRIALRSRSVLSAIVVVAALVGACGGKGSSYNSSKGPTNPTGGASTVPTIVAAGVNAVIRGEHVTTSVDIRDNYFEPNILDGSAGQVVTLTLANKGSALHNFSLTQQSVDTDVAAGKTVTVKVTFPASGTLDFFCKYHKDEAGMAGTLKVSA